MDQSAAPWGRFPLPPANPALVAELIAGAAAALRNLCIRKSGVITLRSTSASKVMLPAPPLMSNLNIDGYDLSIMPQAFYRHQASIDLDAVADAFMAFVEIGGYRHRQDFTAAIEAVSRAYPAIHFAVPNGMTAHALLAQLVHVAGWYQHAATVNQSSVRVFTPRGRFVLYPQAIQWPEGYRRLRRPIGYVFTRPLVEGLAPQRYSRGKCGALFRYLLKTLPEQSEAIRVVFSAAVHSTPENQETLVRAFDLDHVASVERPKAVLEYQKAVVLLSESTEFPYIQIQGLLVPLMGTEKFIETFGYLSRWRGKRYLHKTRLRHQDLLLHMQEEEIAASAAKAGGPTSVVNREAERALALQDMIR